MKILVTGASGFVGAKILTVLSTTHEVIGISHQHASKGLLSLDISQESQVQSLVKEIRPEIIIHSAALTDPDYCEEHPKEAEKINFLGTKYITDICQQVGAKLIYISTMAVFDGTHPPYSEKDIPSPVNMYGKTKRDGEQIVQSIKDHAILRLDQMYGYNGSNLPNGLVGKILAQKRIEANPVNQRRPLLVDDVATVIQKVIERKGTGGYHLAGPDLMTKYELCKKLEEALGVVGDVYPIEAAAQKAKRPLDTSPLTERLNELGVVCTPIHLGLKMIREQYGPNI